MVLTIMIAVLFCAKTKLLFDTDRAFSYLMTSILAAILANMISVYLMALWDNQLMSERLTLWSGRIYLLCMVCVAFFALNYAKVAIVGRKKKNRTAVMANVSFLLLFFLAGFFLHIQIGKKDEILYFYGGYVRLAYGMLMLYLLLCILLVLKYRKHIERRYFISVITFTLMILITVVLVLVFSRVEFLSFAMALALLFMFLEMENPDDYVDSDSGALNEHAFRKWGQRLFQNKPGMRLLIISIPEADYIKKKLGVSDFNNLFAEIAQQTQKLHIGKVFRLDSGEFVCVVKAVEKEEALFPAVSAIIHGLSERYAGISPESVRYGMIPSLENYADMESFLQDFRFYLKHLCTLSGDVLHILDEYVLDEKNEEDFVVLSLKQAILNDEIMVYYQPIYATAKQRFTTAEALIRIKDLNGKFMSPELFIPIAERRGYILTLGHAVFEKVCRFIKEQSLEERGFSYIEINLSTVQCMQKGLASELVSIMKEYSISPGFINLEITETAAIKSEKILMKNMQRLLQLGVSFSLDDYGSGYSNLDYVVRMPFYLVKLDKLLVWDSFKKEKTRVLLETSVEMLKHMQIKIVAEGVETMEQAVYLENIGVDYLQGYYFSKPICEEEFIKIVDNNTRIKLQS